MKLEGSDLAALNDAQRLAVLEALVVGVVADGKVTPPEVHRFQEIVLELPWGLDRAVLAAMVKGAHERIAAMRSPAQVQDYVASLANRLPGAELRDKVVYTMATLMWSDGEVHPAEKGVLGLLVIAFGITSDRAAAIKAALNFTDAPAPPASRGN